MLLYPKGKTTLTGLMFVRETAQQQW